MLTSSDYAWDVLLARLQSQLVTSVATPVARSTQVRRALLVDSSLPADLHPDRGGRCPPGTGADVDDHAPDVPPSRPL